MSDKYVWEVFDTEGNRLGRVIAKDEKAALNAASKAWIRTFGSISTECEEA